MSSSSYTSLTEHLFTTKSTKLATEKTEHMFPGLLHHLELLEPHFIHAHSDRSAKLAIEKVEETQDFLTGQFAVLQQHLDLLSFYIAWSNEASILQRTSHDTVYISRHTVANFS